MPTKDACLPASAVFAAPEVHGAVEDATPAVVASVGVHSGVPEAVMPTDTQPDPHSGPVEPRAVARGTGPETAEPVIAMAVGVQELAVPLDVQFATPTWDESPQVPALMPLAGAWTPAGRVPSPMPEAGTVPAAPALVAYPAVAIVLMQVEPPLSEDWTT